MQTEPIFSIPVERNQETFWKRCFLVYACIEGAYLLVHYLITNSMCDDCVFPAAMYVVEWLFSVLFTAALWYVLFRLHSRQWARLIALNIFVFLCYYFLWIGVFYTLFNVNGDWIAGRRVNQPLRSFVYNSWFDIGKYVLRLTAFYVLKFYSEYKSSEQQRIQLAMLNKDLQLNFFRQQLNPHFYFNTLNNLYGLARSNSPKLQAALHQLSNIMHYVIEDCNKPKVLLSEEMSFLQSYIALEKLRYEQDTVIEMDVRGNANGQHILPLLLIQFVENAFKHGMKEKSENNWMKVNIDIEGAALTFSVDNSHDATAWAEGLGITSVQRRLELMYDGKYDMQLRQEGHRFSVLLKMNLS